MNIEEKLQHIEQMPHQIAFDGCHKLYVLDSPAAIEDAVDIGYDLYPAAQVRDLIAQSCGLVFVNRWALAHEGNDGFKTEWTIDQFEMDEDGSFVRKVLDGIAVTEPAKT